MNETYLRVFILLGILIWLLMCGCTRLPSADCTYKCSRSLYYCYYQVESKNRKKVLARVNGRLLCENQENACYATCQEGP